MSETITLTFDLHVKVDGDGPHAVADGTAVQPLIIKAHIFYAVHTGIGEETCIVQARPHVQRIGLSHSRAVQLQWVSLYDGNCTWR